MSRQRDSDSKMMRMNAKGALMIVAILVLNAFTTGLIREAHAVRGDVGTVSPGKYDYYLNLRNETIAKLQYPNSTILVGTSGDLLFNVTLANNRTSIWIYVPPEFHGFTNLMPTGRYNTSNVWTSYTNDYRFIAISKLNERDYVAPGWWKIAITRVNATIGIPSGSYLIRIFSVKAPSIAGRYFFKIFTNGTSIGAHNFPTLVVKGELNPAYISGVVRYGGWNSTLYGRPLPLPNGAGGKVVASGLTSQGRSVKAQAYFNSSANGRYTLYGLALGTYNLTFQATGFTPYTLPRPITVHAGQSLDGVDAYLPEGSRISGTIWSKCASAPNRTINWGHIYRLFVPGVRPIKLELLSSAGEMLRVDHNSTDPSRSYHRFLLNSSELDGHVPQDNATYISGFQPGDYYLKAYVNGYIQSEPLQVHVHNYTGIVRVELDLLRSGWLNVTVHFKERLELLGDSAVSRTRAMVLEAYDYRGELKAWNVTLLLSSDMNRTLGLTGFLDLYYFRGINDYGLWPGTYMVKAYVAGYTQLDVPFATVGYYGRPTGVSFALVRGGMINLTLNSKDWQMPRTLRPWAYPGRNITAYFYDHTGDEHGFAFVRQPAAVPGVSLSYYGIDYYNMTKSLIPYYMGLHDNALSTGRYFIKVRTLGYIQPKVISIQVIAGHTSDLSIDLTLGGVITLRMNFKTQSIFAPVSPSRNSTIRIEVFDSRGEFVAANITRIPKGSRQFQIAVAGFASYAGNPALRWVNYYDTTDGTLQYDYGISSGDYIVRAWVPGYEQRYTIVATVALSANTTVNFQLDRLARLYGMIRWINMFDTLAPLSWAAVTAYERVMTSTTSLDGFYEMWLPEGKFFIAITLNGYETQTLTISLTEGSEISINFTMNV